MFGEVVLKEVWPGIDLRIAVSDAGKVNGAINDAVDRGVEVMTFDSDAPDSRRFAYYGVDDIKTGQAVMAELAPYQDDDEVPQVNSPHSAVKTG